MMFDVSFYTVTPKRTITLIRRVINNPDCYYYYDYYYYWKTA